MSIIVGCHISVLLNVAASQILNCKPLDKMSFRVPVKRTTVIAMIVSNSRSIGTQTVNVDIINVEIFKLQQQLEIIKSEIHAIKKDFDTCYLKLELMKFEEKKPIKQEGLMIDR